MGLGQLNSIPLALDGIGIGDWIGLELRSWIDEMATAAKDQLEISIGAIVTWDATGRMEASSLRVLMRAWQRGWPAILVMAPSLVR